MVLKIHTDEPAAVTRDGASLARLPTPTDWDASNANRGLPQVLDAADSGWLFAPAGQFLVIKFRHAGGSTRIGF